MGEPGNKTSIRTMVYFVILQLTAGVHCLFFQNPLIRPSLHPGTDYSNSQELVEAMGEIVANQSDVLVQVTNITVNLVTYYCYIPWLQATSIRVRKWL